MLRDSVCTSQTLCGVWSYQAARGIVPARFLSPRLLVRGIAALVLCGALGFYPVLASSVVVPDAFPTVQLGIDSGADSVLIRAGFYPERPLVDHEVVLKGIGTSQRPRIFGLGINNSQFSLFLPKPLIVSGLSFSGRVTYNFAAIAPRQLTLSFSDCTLDSGIVIQPQDADEIELLSIT